MPWAWQPAATQSLSHLLGAPSVIGAWPGGLRDGGLPHTAAQPVTWLWSPPSSHWCQGS